MGLLKPERREAILAFLVRYTAERGYPPTLREIGQAVGMRSTNTVHYHLGEMERLGTIRRETEASGKGTGRSRAIAVVEQSHQANCPHCGR